MVKLSVNAIYIWINSYRDIYRYKFASTPEFSQGDVDGTHTLPSNVNALCEESGWGKSILLTYWSGAPNMQRPIYRLKATSHIQVSFRKHLSQFPHLF